MKTEELKQGQAVWVKGFVDRSYEEETNETE